MVFCNPLEKQIIHALRSKDGLNAFSLCKHVAGDPKTVMHQVGLLLREGLITSRKVAGVEVFNLAAELLEEPPEEILDTPPEAVGEFLRSGSKNSPTLRAVETPPIDAPTTPSIASAEPPATTTQTPPPDAPSVTPEGTEDNTKYKGIYRNPNSKLKPWKAVVHHGYETTRVGVFATVEEALEAQAKFREKLAAEKAKPVAALKEIAEPVVGELAVSDLDDLVGAIVDKMIVAELRRRLQ